MARSRRHKKVHTGSQTAEFSRKLVFCSRAILAACKRFKAENACFRWTRSAISHFWRVYRSAKRDYVQEGERPVVSTSSRGPYVGYSCSGGDLNPHAFRHTPLKRTCLPFHHPSDSKERNLYHGRRVPQVFLRRRGKRGCVFVE